MKIRFLGTSFGAPGAGRYQQSILISHGGGLYIFDAGAPVLDCLIKYGYNPADIRAIFISHLHGDHMDGLLDVLNLAEYYGIHCPVYLSERRGIEAFESFAFLQHCKKCENVDFRLIKSGEFYRDDNIAVDAILTAHMAYRELPSYAFSVKCGDRSVVITSDLSPTLEDFPKRRADLVITECAHFSPEAVCEKITSTKTPAAAIIHVAPTEKYNSLEAMKNTVPFTLLTPEDGEEIEIL
ncbi:MAG: ribonuclease Z [Clostridia bacterium]|nr:ribonuclease Z [Clostridia bacterium]